MKASSVRESAGWRRAMELTAAVYQLTRCFPADERFGLTNQLRRAAVSVVSNIAEGKGRLTKGEFIHFLGMARGSVMEVQAQLDVAAMLGFGDAIEIKKGDSLATEVLKILNSSIATALEHDAEKLSVTQTL